MLKWNDEIFQYQVFQKNISGRRVNIIAFIRYEINFEDADLYEFVSVCNFVWNPVGGNYKRNVQHFGPYFSDVRVDIEFSENWGGF